MSKECRSMKKEMIMGKSPQGVLYRSRKGGWTIETNKKWFTSWKRRNNRLEKSIKTDWKI